MDWASVGEMDPRSIPTPVPFERSFDATVGIDYQAVTPTEVLATLEVRTKLLGLFDRLHGGVVTSVAEAMASVGTFSGVWEEGNVALGMSVQSNVLRSVAEGRLEFVATRLSANPDCWTWEIKARDEAGELCVTATVAVAVRPRPDSAGASRRH